MNGNGLSQGNIRGLMNFIKKHWDGQFSLPFSYWVIGSVLSTIFFIATPLALNWLESLTTSLTYTAWLIVLALLLSCAYPIWAYVGIWKSATNYLESGNSKIWGRGAKLAVILGLLQFSTLVFTDYVPYANSMKGFLTGGDPWGKISVAVVDQGKTLQIKGMFGNGSFDVFERAISSNPNVSRIYLASHGGRLKEVSQIAQVVQSKSLETYVESFCESFCTIVFLAGNPRFATPTAKIGFHTPSLVGAGNLSGKFNDESIRLYQLFNLPDAFIKKIFSTPFEDIWYPTYQELVAAGVVSRLSLGGESNTASSSFGATKQDIAKKLSTIVLFRKYENKFPGFINNAADAALPLIIAGKADSEVFNAIRGIAGGLQTKAVANSTPEIRIRFADLGAAQATEIAKLGVSACAAFILAQLDVTKVLSKALVDQELKLMEDALDSTFVRPKNYTDDAFDNAIQVVVADMSDSEIRAIGAPDATNVEASCTAIVKYYNGIIKLPVDQRDIVTYGTLK